MTPLQRLYPSRYPSSACFAPTSHHHSPLLYTLLCGNGLTSAPCEPSHSHFPAIPCPSHYRQRTTIYALSATKNRCLRVRIRLLRELIQRSIPKTLGIRCFHSFYSTDNTTRCETKPLETRIETQEIGRVKKHEGRFTAQIRPNSGNKQESSSSEQKYRPSFRSCSPEPASAPAFPACHCPEPSQTGTAGSPEPDQEETGSFSSPRPAQYPYP